MTLSENIDEQKIATVVRKVLYEEADNLFSEKIPAFVRENELRARELSVIDRVVRVEGELKALREIEMACFEAMEKHFASLHREMNKRFEAMDKRFESLQREMDKRFEAIDKRFVVLQWNLGIGFFFITVLMGILKFWNP